MIGALKHVLIWPVEGGEGIEISRRVKTCTKFSDHVDTVSTKLNNNNNILNAYYCV